MPEEEPIAPCRLDMSISIFRRLACATAMLSAVPLPAQQLEIAGAVLGHDGGGLARASVELRPLLPMHRQAELQLAGEPYPGAIAHTRTDGDGRFLLVAPGPGFWRVLVHHDEYLPARHDLSPLPWDRDLADLRMQLRSDLVTRVLEGDRPLAGVELRARGWSKEWRESADAGWWPADRLVLTDQDGTAAVPCSSLERVSVAARVRERWVYRVVPCLGGLLELRLQAELSAVVVHQGGQPAAGVYGFVRWPFLAFGRGDGDGRLFGPFDGQGSVPVAFADAEAFYGEPRRLAPTEQGSALLLELPASVQVGGRIVDAIDGRAVRQAWLWVGNGSQHFQIVEGGLFRLRFPISSRVLHFAAPGYLTMAYEVSAGEPPEIEARLTPAMTLAGRVVDSAGVGIAGAEIRGARPSSITISSIHRRLQGSGRWIPDRIRATSDATGSFELVGLVPEARLELRVVHPGFVPHQRTVAAISPGEPVAELVIVLEPGRSAFGKVLNDDEMPIAGAEVALLPSLIGAAGMTDYAVEENYGTNTDEEGDFFLRDLPLGTYYLSARSHRFPELLVPGIEITDGTEPIDLGTVILVPGVTLSGRVVDSREQAVTAAQLSLRNADGEQIVVQRAASPWFAAATSQQNGSFRFEGLPRNSRLALLVAADGFLPREVAVTIAEADQRLEVRLHAGATISGLVLDHRGRPAPGAEVEIDAIGSSPTSTSRQIEADQAGRFEVAGLQPGEYRITARSGGSRSDPLQRILTPEGLDDLYLELRWKATLRVSVTDSDGRAVAGAGVHASPDSAAGANRALRRRSGFGHTDAQGVAVLQALDGGMHRVLAGHPEFEQAEVSVMVEDGEVAEIDLRLEHRAETRKEVTGRVVDRSGLPVAGARVWLAPVELNMARLSRPATSDPDGRFELAAAPGEYRLGCRHQGYAEHLGEVFTVGESDVAELVIELTRGVTVTGRVSGLQPEELSRLVVVARGPYQRQGSFEVFGRRYGSINFAGELRIPGLSPGEWQVRAELLNPTRAATAHLEIDGGEGEVYVDLHFEDGYRVTGSLLFLGAPIAGGTVRLSCPGEFRAETFTDADGRFTIDHVPAGSCTARSTDSESGLSVRQELEVRADSEVVLEIGAPGL